MSNDIHDQHEYLQVVSHWTRPQVRRPDRRGSQGLLHRLSFLSFGRSPSSRHMTSCGGKRAPVPFSNNSRMRILPWVSSLRRRVCLSCLQASHAEPSGGSEVLTKGLGLACRSDVDDECIWISIPERLFRSWPDNF